MEDRLEALRHQFDCFLIWLGAAPSEDCCDKPRKIPTPCIEKREYDQETNPWKKRLWESLPSQACAIERNAAITRQYACWYLQHPHLFKWAGMAAFASHRVGFFLMEGEIHNPDVRLMRDTNNKVFDDVGWAHLAYKDKEGGLKEVEQYTKNQPEYDLLVKGFRLIHEAETLLNQKQNPVSEAMELIWRGNTLLLKHEQAVTVQNSFTEFSYGFKQSLDTLAWATTLDFDANNLKTDTKTRASFEAYERDSRVALDFTKFEDRWAWTISEALPKWVAVDKTDAKYKLQTLVLCHDSSFSTAAINWLKRGRFSPMFNQIDLMLNMMGLISLAQGLVEITREILTEILLKWVLLYSGDATRRENKEKGDDQAYQKR